VLLRIEQNHIVAVQQSRIAFDQHLPTLLTIPVRIFILRRLFIVLLGPAAINEIDTFEHWRGRRAPPASLRYGGHASLAQGERFQQLTKLNRINLAFPTCDEGSGVQRYPLKHCPLVIR
jgi:hypothetical protein